MMLRATIDARVVGRKNEPIVSFCFIATRAAQTAPVLRATCCGKTRDGETLQIKLMGGTSLPLILLPKVSPFTAAFTTKLAAVSGIYCLLTCSH